MSGSHEVHDVLRADQLGRKDVDEMTRMRPLKRVLERFGVDVRSHLGRDVVGKRHISCMRPANAYMAHGGTLAHTNHTTIMVWLSS